MDEEVFRRYRLIGLIGEGGMGKVYRAFDPELEREVAIKVLPTELAREPGYRERFRREARIATRLSCGRLNGHKHELLVRTNYELSSTGGCLG
jgi:serine/threonine protein kinase